MATHDSIGVERRRARLDDNRPCNHPKHSGCKAGDALDRMYRARTDRPTSLRRGHKLQVGLSGIIGEAFREMVKDRTYAALESRAKEKKLTGGRAYGYRNGKVDKGEAYIVREIFGRFADAASCRTIATDLNARRIPSPGRRGNAPRVAPPVGWARESV
jgi:DNA invertase Pin-like site-specific DNA recombinase